MEVDVHCLLVIKTKIIASYIDVRGEANFAFVTFINFHQYFYRRDVRYHLTILYFTNQPLICATQLY